MPQSICAYVCAYVYFDPTASSPPTGRGVWHEPIDRALKTSLFLLSPSYSNYLFQSTSIILLNNRDNFFSIPAAIKLLGHLDLMLDHIFRNQLRAHNSKSQTEDSFTWCWLERTCWWNAQVIQTTKQNVFFKNGTIYREIIKSTVFEDKSSRIPTLLLGTAPDIAPISETNIRSRPNGCGQLDSKNSIHTSWCGYQGFNGRPQKWFASWIANDEERSLSISTGLHYRSRELDLMYLSSGTCLMSELEQIVDTLYLNWNSLKWLRVQLRGDSDDEATGQRVENHRRPCFGHGLQCNGRSKVIESHKLWSKNHSPHRMQPSTKAPLMPCWLRNWIEPWKALEWYHRC